MTAVIGPVRIQYTNLCHGWISFLFVFKIILDMLEILKCHSQIQRSVQFFQSCFFHIDKTIKDFNIFRFFKFCYQSLRFYQSCLTGIHRVDTVIFDCCEFFVRDISFNHGICSLYSTSTGGSENTHVHAFSNTSSEIFSTS